MNSKALALFYKIKPLMPRGLQLFLRGHRAQKIFGELKSPYLIDGINEKPIPVPDGYDCVVLLTHDVETHNGLAFIEPMRKIERLEGVVSTWNFVLDKYGTHPEIIRSLQDEGCECGAHGLTHDGKLFADEETYTKRMEHIIEIADKLKLTGFRSPALHRNAEWMKTIPFKWDSSFPAWDPFQPQPGGCKQYSPFKLNETTWELP
ncbi:MAG: hypothetical protein K8S62_07090, partial [Candidatus Sabulitectum sp.]|nr:hypothetical protein [Candidatus Sabulitectum sp.]